MNDFEKHLKDKLNAQVDAELGRRTAAPPFSPNSTVQPTPRRRSFKRWTLPLLAAACVLVVVGGTVGAVQLLGEKHAVAPGSNVPSPNVPSPNVTTTPTPTPTPTPSHSTSHATPDPHRTVVQLAGAAISLPLGWVATDESRYLAPPYQQAWCLGPASKPVRPPGSDGQLVNCNLEIGTIPDAAGLDVDIEGGWSANPHPCGQPTSPASEEQSGDRPLGGRLADWRQFRWDCSFGTQRYEQYVVATRPGFILYSGHADAAMDGVMTGIATHSQLPAQTSALRYMDRGYLRSAQPMADGVHITLDRVVLRDDGDVTNNNPAVYDYVIPTKLWNQADSTQNVAKPPKVGTLVYLQSNGTRITVFGVVLR